MCHRDGLADISGVRHLSRNIGSLLNGLIINGKFVKLKLLVIYAARMENTKLFSSVRRRLGRGQRVRTLDEKALDNIEKYFGTEANAKGLYDSGNLKIVEVPGTDGDCSQCETNQDTCLVCKRLYEIYMWDCRKYTRENFSSLGYSQSFSLPDEDPVNHQLPLIGL
jgi:hypothetical protein